MLKARIITALFLIPLVLGGLLVLEPSHFATVAAIFFIFAALEWSSLCQLTQPWQKGLYLLGFLLSCLFLYWVNSKIFLFIGALLWLLPLYSVLKFPQGPFLLKSKAIKALLGILVLALAWYGLCVIQETQGALWALFLFILVWSCDTFAYFVGRKWGKRPFTPVSPNKTLAGFWGGVLGGLFLACVLYGLLLSQPFSHLPLMPFWVWLSIAYITLLLAVLGDLFESFMKRLSGVKDSGQMLPGHGGILDRIDSLIAALPFYALSVLWTIKG